MSFWTTHNSLIIWQLDINFIIGTPWREIPGWKLKWFNPMFTLNQHLSGIKIMVGMSTTLASPYLAILHFSMQLWLSREAGTPQMTITANTTREERNLVFSMMVFVWWSHPHELFTKNIAGQDKSLTYVRTYWISSLRSKTRREETQYVNT